MGRSVSVPCNAEVVYYTYIDYDADDFAYDDLVDNIKWTLKSKYKSLCESDKWIDRENRVLLENDLVQIGISEYMGCISLWIVPLDYYPNLSYNFIEYAKETLKTFATLKKQGTMSNGVSVYEKIGCDA